MSLVQVRRSHSASGVPRKKHVALKKPAWDITSNDLELMKATPEEIAYRKASHQSKHALTARLQKQTAASNNKKKQANLSISNSEARQLAIMKEVLYDQRQLQSVIAKSDKMMANVKDLFGDDPRRFAGFPNVTAAPNTEEGEEQSLVAPDPPINTRMEFMSDSVMDASALNDIPDSDSDDDGVAAEPITYEPKMNMARFQQFLSQQEKNHSMSTISGQAQISQLANGPGQSTQLHRVNGTMDSMMEESGMHTPPKGANESVSILRTPKSAMNDTKKIKKTKKRVVTPKAAQHNTSSGFNLTDLRKVLEGLQDEIADFEKKTGRGVPAERQRQETFSGYTLSLVDSVTKLSRYLKETDVRLNAEVVVREQLMQDVAQLTSLIDALTSDIISSQEEYTKLKEDFIKYKMETQSEIHTMKNVLIDAGLMDTPRPSQSSTTPTRSEQLFTGSSISNDDLERLMNVRDFSSIPEHLRSAAAAVLLSPPVRKSRVQNDQVRAARQASLIDVPPMADLSNHRTTSESSNYSPTQNTSSNPQTFSQSSSARSAIQQQDTSQSVSHPSSGGVPTYIVPVGKPDSVTFTSQGQQQNSQYNPQHKGDNAVNQYGHGVYVQSGGQVGSRVTVPRPIPLVQGNMDGFGQVTQSQQHLPVSGYQGQQHPPVSGYQGQHQPPVSGYQGQHQPPVSGYQGQQQPQTIPETHPVQTNVPLGAETAPVSNSRDHLASQIAELNRQHEEAQQRMQNLLQQQKQQQEMHREQQETLQQAHAELQASSRPRPEMVHHMTSEPQESIRHRPEMAHHMTTEAPRQKQIQQQGLPYNPVSPPISPISQRSDKFMPLQRDTSNNAALMGNRGITISLPSVTLETSTEDSPSPKRA